VERARLPAAPSHDGAGKAAPPAAAVASARAAASLLFPLEADALFPYGHLRREGGGGRGDAAVIALRGGIGVAKAGDHPFHRAEWSDGFAGAGKPPKWYADPAGPAPKLTWKAATQFGGSAVAGRPLWARPA